MLNQKSMDKTKHINVVLFICNKLLVIYAMKGFWRFTIWAYFEVLNWEFIRASYTA